MLISHTYKIQPLVLKFNLEALNREYNRVCIFDSNSSENLNQPIEASKIIAVGSTEELLIKDSKNTLFELQNFYTNRKGWLFGYISYEIKNEIEQVDSKNKDELKFPSLLFFAPKVVIKVKGDSILLIYDDAYTTEKEAQKIYQLSISFPSFPAIERTPPITISPRINKLEYIESVNRLKQHIQQGDIYEINYCQEFFAKNVDLNPVSAFEKLNAISLAPFTAFCKFGTHYVICASPERYLQKKGNKLISQPIKGTIKRSKNPNEDERLKQMLKNNEKERSENVMIVDLVRNDFSRIAKAKNVIVEELFGLYSFKQLHQMISTISCEIETNTPFTEIIKSTFPMGSMTGAPKISAMKLIDEYEKTKRGLYSGTIGYITPDGDFDFNVVIRSILYNSKSKYLSFMVGSAITDKAIAEDEYEECLLKAEALFQAINQKE